MVVAAAGGGAIGPFQNADPAALASLAGLLRAELAARACPWLIDAVVAHRRRQSA